MVLLTNSSSAATGHCSFKSRNISKNGVRHYYVNGTLEAAKLSVASRTLLTCADAHQVWLRRIDGKHKNIKTYAFIDWFHSHTYDA